jgi:response regulator of citrate/malate metabolism
LEYEAAGLTHSNKEGKIMTDGLDVIIVDDDQMTCELVTDMIEQFYTWGKVISFNDATEAVSYCQSKDTGVAIFVLDVFLADTTGFNILDAIVDRFPMAHQDTIIMTGMAGEDVVDMCLASDITHLLEKPIRPYALQLAVRTIVAKYLRFAKRLLMDPSFAEAVARV